MNMMNTVCCICSSNILQMAITCGQLCWHFLCQFLHILIIYNINTCPHDQSNDQSNDQSDTETQNYPHLIGHKLLGWTFCYNLVQLCDLLSPWILCVKSRYVTLLQCIEDPQDHTRDRPSSFCMRTQREHFGLGVLACATRGGGRSEAGHCFHLLFSSFSFSFSYSFCFFTHIGESPVRENLFPPIFWHN